MKKRGLLGNAILESECLHGYKAINPALDHLEEIKKDLMKILNVRIQCWRNEAAINNTQSGKKWCNRIADELEAVRDEICGGGK